MASSLIRFLTMNDSVFSPSPSISPKMLTKAVTSLLCSALLVLCPQVSLALQIGDTAPDFPMTVDGETQQFHNHINDRYVLFFSHPHDFTPVCTTELAAVHNLKPTLDGLNTVAIGLSVDSQVRHTDWKKDILSYAGSDEEDLNYVLLSDEELIIAKKYDMLNNDGIEISSRNAKTNHTARTVFLIGKDKKIKLMLTYPMYIGRNFDEIVRTLKAQIIFDEKQLASPANWQEGEKLIVSPGLTDDEARNKYGNFKTISLPSFQEGHKNYLRFVDENAAPHKNTEL